jgi:hypothetical protein
MARNQETYKKNHSSKYTISQFVTVIVRPKENMETEIECYMVSDMCQALERDGIFADSEDKKTLKIREQKGHEVIPTVFMENKPVTTLDPIFFIVNVLINIKH